MCEHCAGSQQQQGREPLHGGPGLPRSALTVISFPQAGAEPGPSLASPWLCYSACPTAFCEHPSNKIMVGTSNELCSLPARSDARPRSTFPCLASTIPAAPGPPQQDAPSPSSLPTRSPLQPPDQGSPSGPPGPFPRAVAAQGHPREGCSGQAQGTQTRVGASAGAQGARSGGCWGTEETEPQLQQRTFMGPGRAGNRTQRHAGHRDGISCRESWVPQGWCYLGPAQCRNCGTGEGMRMSWPFSSRRSQSIR